MSNIVKKRDFFNTVALKDFFEDEEDFFNRFFKRKGFPLTNVSEDKDKYHMEVSVPGVEKDKIKLSRDGDTLTISYNEEKTHEENEKNYHKKEFHKESFMKSFTIPQDVDTDKIISEHKDGVLKIDLPKKPEAIEKKNQIEIEIK